MPSAVDISTVKCVVIGDGAVGKVFDNYAVSLEVGGQKITLNLLDTAVTNRISFENIRDKWFPELRSYSPGIPFILVGTQVDRRPTSDASSNIVSQAEGVRLAKELEAVSYIECSALTREGLREVFVNAILAALDPKKARASGLHGNGKSGRSRSKKASISVGRRESGEGKKCVIQ